jgi:hypothetical protein
MRHRLDINQLNSDCRGTRLEIPENEASIIHSANPRRNPTMTTTETEKVTHLPYKLTCDNVVAFMTDQLGMPIPIEAAVEASAAAHPITGAPRRKVKNFKYKMADLDTALAKTALSISDRMDLKAGLAQMGLI